MIEREQFKTYIKRYPRLYYHLRIIYHAVRIRRIKEILFKTKVREKEWATRDLRDGDEWSRGYWDSYADPHRSLLMSRIASFSPFSRILEVGCCSGPNLRLLADKYPDAEIIGIDISSSSIRNGNKWFSQEGINNVKLQVGKADDLTVFPDKYFDVVFTDAVLVLIGPDKINKVINEMLRVARQGLILNEWHFTGKQNKHKHALGVIHLSFWKRDYIALMKQFKPNLDCCVTKVPEEMRPAEGWKELGHIIEVRY